MQRAHGRGLSCSSGVGSIALSREPTWVVVHQNLAAGSRSHQLAPFVRQTGERKAQTCAKGILRQHRLLSACSKRARIGTHRPLPQHTSDDNAFYHSGGDQRKATRPLAAIETSVVPGEFFEQPQHFRIGFGGATETVRAGLERLCAALEAFHQPSR
jgi:hypothetical protein